jgi:hypothetical protein
MAGGFGTKPRTLIAVTDFPEPDSPTSPTTSPLFNVSDAPLIALTTPSEVLK